MEWTSVVVALIAATPPMGTVIIGLWKINKRMDKDPRMALVKQLRSQMRELHEWQQLHELRHLMTEGRQKGRHGNSPRDPRHPGQAGGAD